jgi:hypothetical protein
MAAGIDVRMEAGMTASIEAGVTAASGAARGWAAGGVAMAVGLPAMAAAGFATRGEFGRAVMVIG